MKKIVYVIASLFLIPLVVSAETIPVGSTNRFCSGSITGIKFSYTIGGKSVTCMDPDLTSPYYVNQSTTFSFGESKFADGLIAMSNYAKKNNVSECDQSEAFRIYPFKAGDLYLVGHPGVISNGNPGIIEKLKNYSPGDNAVGKMIKVGLCAHGDESYCDENDDKQYIPSDNSEAGEIKATVDTQDATTSGKKYTINATIGIEKENSDAKVTFKGCSGSGIKCSASGNTDLTNSSSIDIVVTGTISKKTTVDVTLNFDGIGGNGDLITDIKLYTCSGNANVCSPINHYPPTNVDGGLAYQRFVELVNGKSTDNNSEVKVTLKVPSLCNDPNMSDEDKLNNGCANCDSIDPTTLEEDSKEEDAYIKQCGPIVHLENDCGVDTCDTEGNLKKYKAFNHSFIRGRSMKYIMLDLDDEGMNSSGAKPYMQSYINQYCGTFATEKVDIYTPATAASVSGQFFIFDSYNDSYGNTNSYFRQPYVVDRSKSTFFFDAKNWNKEYSDAVRNEKNMFKTWQNAIPEVQNTYYRYINHLCTKPVYDDDGIYIGSEIDDETCYENWQSAVGNEKNAKIDYGNAVGKRTGLQYLRDDCKKEWDTYDGNFDLTNDPNITFTYDQNSEKYGKQTNKVDMVVSNSAVKYWPNVTSNSISSTDYLGTNAFNLDRNTAQNPGTGTDHYLRELDPNITSRIGVMLTDEIGTTTRYEFPNASIDGCGGGDMCKVYEYHDMSFISKQASSNSQRDPYLNIKTISNETISKLTFYRPPQDTFALMNTGEYKTINYESNASMKNLNGLEIGYVYNIELTSYKGQYTTKFSFENLGYSVLKNMFSEAVSKYLAKHPEIDGVGSTCNYCNMEMAFKRNCDECDPNDPTTYDFEPQFYYRSISLSDVTPNEREGETNWTDAKGQAAEALIEQGSGLANNDTVNNNEYVALANGNDYSKDGKISTYLADSSNVGKHDIYDDGTRDYLEYEVTLTTKNLQMIKRNSSRSYFNYAKMNMCAEYPMNVKDSDEQYCFKCNSDMKECESSFVTSFFSDTTGRSKWKYYVNGKFCTGSISSCIKGLDYVMVDSSGNTVENKDGIYPDPLYPQKFLEEYKNWP